MVSVVKPEFMRRAVKQLRAAAEAGELDLSSQATSDWHWSWDDPQLLVALGILEKGKLLTPFGEQRMEEVENYQHPPPPPPPIVPVAVLNSGSMVGQLALLGVGPVLAGAVRARGPVLVCILHRHILLEALKDSPEREFFNPRGVSPETWAEVLSSPVHKASYACSPHLGPVAGPPPRPPKEAAGPPAGSFAAWKQPGGPFEGMPGADALVHVLLRSLRECALMSEIITEAPPRLLEALVRSFEPRWLLANEVVVVDEEPDADFLVVTIYGRFKVLLEGAEIEYMEQGVVQGAAQLLALNDWTRTISVNPAHSGEAMVQVLRRDRLLEVLRGHPVPRGRLVKIEQEMRDAKEADWHILKNIPVLGCNLETKFLKRVFKDADIRFFCPGDLISEIGEPGASLYVVLAGQLRSEHPQTLFYIELKRGDWVFQDNILGNSPTRSHDVVAVSHAMVLILYRHALLKAVSAFPSARKVVLENELWRRAPSCPSVKDLRFLKGVPEPVLDGLAASAYPGYFRPGSLVLSPGSSIQDGALMFLLRGQMQLTILGLETRTMGEGDCLGTLEFLGLEAPPCQARVVARTACDVLYVPRTKMDEALQDEEYEDALIPYTQACNILAGGQILDAFGFPIGGGAFLALDCIERSEVFSACSTEFVCQMPELVEDVAFWPGEALYRQGDDGNFMYFVKAGRVRLEALGRREHVVVSAGATLGDMAVLNQAPAHTETAIAETPVWARLLHRRLLERVLASFPEEERRLTGTMKRNTEGIFGSD